MVFIHRHSSNLQAESQAPVAQLVRASDLNSEDPIQRTQVQILAGSQCFLFFHHQITLQIKHPFRTWTLRKAVLFLKPRHTRPNFDMFKEDSIPLGSKFTK